MKSYAPWHFLYFLPLPQGQGSLRPTFVETGCGRDAPFDDAVLRPLLRAPLLLLLRRSDCPFGRSSPVSLLLCPPVCAIASALVCRSRGSLRWGSGRCNVMVSSLRISFRSASTV